MGFNKKVAAIVSGSVLAMAISSAATAEESGPSFSANVGVVTDYRFRGISQSDSNPAVQAGVDLDLGNGFYAGTWASQVDFAYGADETDFEQDFYGGYAGETAGGVGYDVGYIYYAYHGSDQDEDYQEVYGSLSFGDASVGFAYSDDYWLQSGAFYYLNAGYSFSLANDISLDLSAGLNLFDEEIFLNGSDSYIDYSVSVGKEFGGLALSASLVGTDVSDEECFLTDWCEPTVLAGASYSW
ncbi:TorF family putative porin [Microbulbifer agarilyticus]|uniref:TorF family putative porin n=1 Tax=Microbulbifer agarilyticus TaxID=260552 RepID=UPI001C97182A|nr:TorF family putative porin [Microbulbifer agarilyticus]MBY6190661.1 TorF family putative porin [Microbulbifer agarilyticus]